MIHKDIKITANVYCFRNQLKMGAKAEEAVAASVSKDEKKDKEKTG